MAQYEKLRAGEHKDLVDSNLPPGQSLKKRRHNTIISTAAWLVTLTITILFMLLLVAYLSTWIQGTSSPQTTASECGSTAEEAHENDCIYSFVPGAWIPRRCHDSDLEAQFLRQQNWRWWADNTTQVELSLDQVRSHAGESPIYVSMEYHDYHCAYTWLAMHRAVVGHTLIDTHIGNFTHTQHCARSMARAHKRRQKIATFYPIFASCMEPGGHATGVV